MFCYNYQTADGGGQAGTESTLAPSQHWKQCKSTLSKVVERYTFNFLKHLFCTVHYIFH